MNLAAVAKLWAERRAGELLAAMPKNGGGRPVTETGRDDEPVFVEAPTLEDLGVSKHESSRWQQLAETLDADLAAVVSSGA